MTSIDEIMGLMSEFEPSKDEVRSLIAAALADARREGAEAMRESAAVNADQLARRLSGTAKQLAREHSASISALPLPTTKEQS